MATHEDVVEALQQALGALEDAVQVRTLQRSYFQARSSTALYASKNAERLFDRIAPSVIERCRRVLQQEGAT